MSSKRLRQNFQIIKTCASRYYTRSASNQNLNIDKTSNKLPGFTQTLTKVRSTRTLATTNANVSYALDAAGNLTSDGLRTFEYDPANRLAKLKILKDGEASSISYLHNSLGQRVFKGEPVAEQTLPDQAVLGEDFISYLKRQFGWLFTAAQSNASIGTAFTYADGQLPEWALLGEYDNGSASGKGRTEYLWLPTEDGSAVPVGLYRNGKFFAIHADHLGTPRLITNEQNQPVWQWPYSAFGNNKPTGILKATPNPRAAITNQPVLLRATNPAAVVDLRFPGQHADDEAGVFYNYQRNYQASQGRYTQNDPIGLDGGFNRYGYVGGSPILLIDPFGLDAVGQAAGSAIGTVGGRLVGGALGTLIQPGAGTAVGAAVGGAVGGRVGGAVGSAIGDICNAKNCPPCKTVSGRTVAPGTIGYRPLDVIPDNEIQHGVAGSHHNIFIANQNPNNCQCFWAKQKYVLKPNQLPLGAVPFEAFVN